jgi:hypothetical protein
MMCIGYVGTYVTNESMTVPMATPLAEIAVRLLTVDMPTPMSAI